MISVYNDGPIGGGSLKEVISKEELKRRGWGGIMRSAYHPIMESMQNELNSILLNNELQGWWKDNSNHPAGEWGDWNNNPPLTELPDNIGLKHAAEIRYEVWAGGYNWLQSNELSASDIIHFIDNTVLKSYEAADSVIIVTHSMGGSSHVPWSEFTDTRRFMESSMARCQLLGHLLHIAESEQDLKVME